MKNLLVLRKYLALPVTVLLALVILLPAAIPAMAQENKVGPGRNVNAPAAPSHALGPTDAAELEGFLDDLLRKEMQEHHIAGAAVSVVKDGKLFFAKGYGSANLEEGTPVDPERTVFRTGSVGKLFTWTAVMQLVEQGKLDLNADINAYLDFKIPDTFPQPITLKNLMTHTAGFEDRAYEQNVLNAGDFVPVREWLVSHMPARVRPPGDAPAYSNYGAALAGYIVSRVSGQPYDQYIQDRIFSPLGMAHSTARLPIPPDLHALTSAGYTYANGALQAFPEYMSQPAIVPAGAQLASAADMARFMIAHLQNGSYSDASIAGARILNEATALQMHSTLYSPDPRLLGSAYGFFDFSDNGQRTIGHVGESYPFHTLLLLLPDQRLGVFVAYNSDGGGKLTLQHLGFQRAFFDHYFPVPPVQPIQPPADFAARTDRFVGSYKSTWSSYTTLEKYSTLLGAAEISNPGDGTLLFTTPYGDWRFVEAGPLYFRQVDGSFAMVFREDGQGHITRILTSFAPQFAFEKVPWYEMPGFSMGLVLVCILVFLCMIAVAAIRGLRIRLSHDLKPVPGGARVAQWIIVGICVLNLLLVLGSILWGEQNLVPLFGVSLIFKIVLGLGVLAAILTAGALLYAVVAWKNSYWGFPMRMYYTLVTVAAVAFVWFLNDWNLLGWRF